jgi:hypothetical protein
MSRLRTATNTPYEYQCYQRLLLIKAIVQFLEEDPIFEIPLQLGPPTLTVEPFFARFDTIYRVVHKSELIIAWFD